MLPQHLRLRKSADYMSVMRQGRRVCRPTLVLYALGSEQARVGLVVSKAVGGATVRNRVKRRLRHGALELIRDSHPMDVVVRALPGADSASLKDDLGSAWAQAARQVTS